MLGKPRQTKTKLNLQLTFLVLVVAFGVGFRLWMISYIETSPYPPVDIYYADTQAAQFILNLQNPYTQIYTIHNYTLDFYAYLPMVPVFYAPFYLMGDIRFGNIFADVLIMLALYSIGASLSKKSVYAIFAPFTYAILPMSIWLTSATGSNMMIGTAFLVLSLAALLREKFGFSALFLGLGIATNQFVALLLPVFGYYFWTKHKSIHMVGALSLAVATVIPFIVPNASKFIYGVLTYQMDRPLQIDGPFSLFSFLYLTWGVQPSFLIRGGLFVASTVFALLALRYKRWLFVPLCGLLVCLGAYLLPINGFWNYFLPAVTLICTLVPAILEKLEDLTGIHLFKKKSSASNV